MNIMLSRKQANKEVYQIKLTLLLVGFALALIYFIELSLTPYNYVETAMLVSIGISCFLFFWVDEDTIQVVIGIILWGSTTLIFYLSWINVGLFDSALFAYPCVILLSYVMGSRALFSTIVLGIFIQLVLLMMAHEFNLLDTHIPQEKSYRMRTIDLSVILILFSSITYLFVRDFKVSLKELALKKQHYFLQLQKTKKILQYDPLTGMPNDHICKKDVADYIADLSARTLKMSFMVLDITNLRQVNNSFGHSVGDLLLVEIARRLESMLMDDEHIYRLQGNEFVLIKLADDTKDFEVFKERIVQAMVSEFIVGEYNISASCAIGIAIAPFDGESLDILRKNSHLALQYSKATRSSNTQYFAPYMQQLEDDKYFFLYALKGAIEQQQFTLHYQPKYNLQTNKIIGAEALIRWFHPDKGWIAPDKFIPVAEESGHIVEITKWITAKACLDCMEWHNLGHNNISVAINLSAVDFKRGNLPQIIFNALSKSNLSPHLLELEITESTIFEDVSHIQTQIRQMQNKGISFAIDDFGTGYSNLGYLNKFNVSVLKIDQSFIKNITELEHDQHIIKAIVLMSHSLGILNVAEGIEDLATATWLKKIGCNIGQGYFWSKPLPQDEFIALLQQQEDNSNSSQ